MRYKQISLSFHKTRPGRPEHKVFLQNMTWIIFGIYHEYLRMFWNVVVISFFDHVSNAALIFPFLPLILPANLAQI